MKKFTCNPEEQAEIFFQNISEDPRILNLDSFKQVVLVIPYCRNSDEIRLKSKKYRAAYGPHRCLIIDIDETFPIHRKLQDKGLEVTTELLAANIMESYQ